MTPLTVVSTAPYFDSFGNKIRSQGYNTQHRRFTPLKHVDSSSKQIKQPTKDIPALLQFCRNPLCIHLITL